MNPFLVFPMLLIVLLFAGTIYLARILRKRTQTHEDAMEAMRRLIEEKQAQLQQTEYARERLVEELARTGREEERQRAAAESAERELAETRRQYGELERDFAVLHTRFEEAQRRHGEQIRLLEEAKTAMGSQFENLANRIFEQKSKTFDTANQQQLKLLLGPFRAQIDAFAKQARTQYVEESKERHLLNIEIERL
ncbi:MAG: hypothetical protein P8Y65_00530 [Campylobacterales bacterium]